MLKCRISYLLILCATFFFYLFYPDYLSFLSLLFVLLLPVFLFVLVILASRKISASLELDSSSVCKKEEFPVCLHLRNRFFLPLSRVKAVICMENGFTGEQKQFSLFLPIGSHGKEDIRWTMSSSHCGQVCISLDRLSVYDYLGLFTFSVSTHNHGIVDVIPDCREISPRVDMGTQICMESDLYSTQKPGSDPSETFGLREYMPGDSLHSVHWKLSAKSGQWMVRQCSAPLSHSIVLLIEFFKPSDPSSTPLDTLLDCTFSLSHFLLQNQLRHFLCWYDTSTNQLEQFSITSEEDLHTFLHHILTIKCYVTPTLALECYERQYAGFVSSHFFYFLASHVSSDVQTLISRLKNHRNTIFTFSKEPLTESSYSLDVLSITSETLRDTLDHLLI